MNKFLILTLLGLIFTGISRGTGTSENSPCAVVTKSGKGVEAIPLKGKILTRFKDHAPLECGSMIVTHAEGISIRLDNQVTIKIAPNSFFEIAKAKKESHRLYRGEVLVDAPVGTPVQAITTPNGKVMLQGGVDWIQYHAEEKETTVAAFSKTCKFQNKFDERAEQTVHAGEMSRLALDGERIIPTQPELVEPGSAESALEHFDLAAEEKTKFMSAVTKVVEGRTKSFTAELENWKENKDAEETYAPSRGIASVKKKDEAVDELEAEHTMNLLKARLYGESEELKHWDEEDRKPASVGASDSEPKALNDSFYEQAKKKNKAESKRLMDKISRLPVEDQ